MIGFALSAFRNPLMVQDSCETSLFLHAIKAIEKNIPIIKIEIRIMIIFMILVNENKINFFSLCALHAIMQAACC
jgi:hypothetical protein